MAGRRRPWVFTLNNPIEDEVRAIDQWNENHVKSLIVSYETGKEGTTHLQGYVEFKNAKGLKATKKWLGSERYHLEFRMGTPYEAYFYCIPFKDGGTDELKTRKNCKVLTELGERPLEVELSCWERIVKMIQDGASNLELAGRYPHEAVRCASAIDKYRLEWDRQNAGWRDLNVTYLSGPTGVGKTRQVMEMYGYENVYRITNKKHPFDTYNGQDVLVFEEFRNSFKIEEMLNYLDGYPIELPARYANKMAKYTKVYILTNWKFNEQYNGCLNNHPATYAAWVRRVHTIIELDEDDEGEILIEKVEVQE